MTATRDRNGVLIFVAPRSQKFAVIGDTGIHECCGDEFWRRLVEVMQGPFKAENSLTPSFTPSHKHAACWANISLPSGRSQRAARRRRRRLGSLALGSEVKGVVTLGFWKFGLTISLFDQLLKLRIIAHRIPDRIDAQQRRRQWSER